MSDDPDAEDGNDWLSSQFDATAQVPAQPAVHAPPQERVAPPPVTPPSVKPSPSSPLTPAPTAEVASAPTANAGGGFNWGLKPGGAAPPPATPPTATPPAVTPAAAAPATEKPAAPFPWVSPPTELYAAPPTRPFVSEPTQPLSWDEFASTQRQSPPAPIPPVPVEQPTEAYTVRPWQPAAATSPPAAEKADPADPTTAIDSLFGDHRFQDYEEVGVIRAIQVPPGVVDESAEMREPHEPLSQTQKVLLGVAAGLLGALILVASYFLGHQLGSATAVRPTAARTGAASATPTPAGTGGRADPGVQQWTALQGGECIQPFSSAWALTYTVVACTTDHDGQMVFKGKLPDDASTKYPSVAGFQKEITPLCSAPTSINYAAAASVTDLQVSFSYPPSTADWLSGDRTYYCFVNRVSGGNLTGDLSVQKTP